MNVRKAIYLNPVNSGIAYTGAQIHDWAKRGITAPFKDKDWNLRYRVWWDHFSSYTENDPSSAFIPIEPSKKYFVECPELTMDEDGSLVPFPFVRESSVTDTV